MLWWMGGWVALVLLATTSVTKQRQISCHFYTEAKYRKHKYYSLHHAGLLHSKNHFFGESVCDNVDDTDDDEGQ